MKFKLDWEKHISGKKSVVVKAQKVWFCTTGTNQPEVQKTKQ